MSTSDYLKKLEEIKARAYGTTEKEKTADKSSSSNEEKKSSSQSVLERIKSSEAAQRATERNDTPSSSTKGMQGWQKYLEDDEAERKVAVSGKDDEKWWETLGRWLGGGAVDTTLPTAGVTQTINDLRVDNSHRRPNEDWSLAQKSEFGELYLESPEVAYAFAEETNAKNNKAKEEAKIKEIQDSATSSLGAGVGHTLGAVATAPLGMADFLNDLAMSNAGRPITSDGIVSPFEYSQAVTGGITEHLNEEGGTLNENIPIIGGKGWGDVYGLGTSILQSAASAYTLGGAGTLISYFGQGAASGMDEALSRGASDGQAAFYGIALGTFEGIAESIGVDNLFKIGSSSTLKGLIKNILKQAGAEGTEEALTSFLGNIADNLIMQDQSNFYAMVKMYMSQGMTEDEAKKKAWMDSVEGIAYDALGGFVSGGVHGGVHTSVHTALANHDIKQTFGSQSQNIVNEALAMPNSAVQSIGEKYQAKLNEGKNLSGWNLHELIEATDTAKLKNATLKRLGDLGETSDVTSIADIVLKQARGEELTSKDWNILNNSKAGYHVINETNEFNIKSGALANKWAENLGTKIIKPKIYHKKPYELAEAMAEEMEAAEKNSVANTIADSETATGTKFEASERGKTTYTDANGNTRDVTVKGIASTEGGLKVELKDGSTVNATDLSFGSKEESLMYEMVARMEVTPETANELIKTFKPKNIKQASMYFTALPLAYQYGKMGYEAGLKNIPLSDNQKRIAYNRGRADAIQADKVKTKSTIKNGTVKASTENNGIIYENGYVYDEATANELQKASMPYIEFISKMSHLEVHVFESWVENGKRVAYVNGKRVSAPNGYFRNGNQIFIDINAGNKGEGAMLYTMAHEVTHYIRAWNAKGFREIGDFLIAEFGKQGVPVNALLEAQKDKIKKRYKEERKALPSEAKLADMAYEELVADAMSDMLTDPKAYEKLAKFKKKNFKGWQKLGEAIKAVLDKIKSALGVYKTKDAPVAKEAMFVRGFSAEAYEKLQDLYIKAFVKADANYEASIGSRNLNDFAEAKNENGETLFQYRAMEADEDTYRQMLQKWGKMTSSQIDNLFATIDNAMELIKDNLEALDYAWEADIDDRAFSPVKPNSDKLYQVSLDFSTLCRKRILQQTVQAQLQEALNKPLSREEGIAIRDALMALQEEGRQIEVACALCYVESARMKSPEQIKKFINNKEKVIKDFFANKSGGNIKEKIKQAEADARERLGVGNASLKSLPGKVAQEIRDAKKAAKESYKPTAEEQELIEVAKGMTVSDFTSPEGLENLAKKYPRLFDAYTSYIRNATKSKGIENDTWWRAGDSMKIGDVLIANMNRENGLRTQSWSDFQVIHILDYIASTIELATRNTKAQAYSKVPDYVELMGSTGILINMSLIPTAKFNGSLDYDSVEGIDYKRALELRDKYHKTAGTICIGVDNVQIQLLLADTTIDYVIPYHRSGMSKALRKLMHIPTWSDYELYQSESNLSRADAEKQAKKYGVKLLDASDPNYHRGTSFSEWFDIKEAQQIAKMENANPSDKAKQKKYGVMYGGYMAMQNAANNYLKLCAERGIAPKFSHEKADFTAEENYWKLLIDRKMVDNVTGEVIEQQTIKPIFNEGEIMRILNDELARYPKVKEDQDYAIRRVTEKMLSGEIKGGMSAEAIAKVMKKPVDNVTNVNILASAEDMKLSDRDSAYEDYSKPITVEDVQVLRPMGDKSINDFTPEDIEITQKWAYKFYKELGVKSPFFRAWFGDWRAYDINSTKVIDANRSEGKNPRGKFINRDTGWEINSSSVGYDETISHSGKNKKSIIAMQNIDKIIENAILLDTEVSEYGRGKKSVYTAFMHKFYALCRINGKLYIAKMAVDESYAPGQDNTNKKFYHVRAIEIETASSVGIGESHTPIIEDTVSEVSIADLFKFVKSCDNKFKPTAVNPLLLNEDGTPKNFYHGTAAKFSVFDIEKAGRNWGGDSRLGKGFYFAYTEDEALRWTEGTNVIKAYLNLKNPLNVDAPTPKNIAKEIDKYIANKIASFDENNSFISKEQYIANLQRIKEMYMNDVSMFIDNFKYDDNGKMTDGIREFLSSLGYDGIVSKDETVAFYPDQIKSATDNIGTFNKAEDDIHYSDRDSDGNELSAEQQQFFRDSKVRDKNGNLLVCTHHSPSKFTVFDESMIGENLVWGKGFYFYEGSPKQVSHQYGENQYKVYLDIKKPFTFFNNKDEFVNMLEMSGYDYDRQFVNSFNFEELEAESFIDDFLSEALPKQDAYEAFTQMLKMSKYDGIWSDGVLVVFHPTQIKLTTNKKPTSDPDIRYSDRDVDTITEAEYKDLEKHFGTTANFKVAGYLLTDGKLLDFSGKHWGDTTSRSRQVDHRDVQEVLGRGNNGINDMVDMIGNGNIRLMPEIGGINLAVYPNEKQRRVLSLYINQMLATEGQVIIDYDAVGGDTVYSRTYEKGTASSRILSDIRNYFNGGRQSDLMRFHTEFSDADIKYSIREEAPPKKTVEVYKLMRLKDGKIYPLFIDSTEPLDIGTWYDADSPNLDFLKKLPSGIFLIDTDNESYTTFADYLKKSGEKKTKLPSKKAIEQTASDGLRWVYIEDTAKGQKRFGGETRKYWNLGINGSGAVSTFSMRPGYHAGSLPTMRQIGKGANKDLRDDSFVWTVGEVPADIDYQSEADRNPDKDIPTHIPVNGYYLKATNADKAKSQADVMGWYVAGSYKINRVISDSEARRIIDDWNAEHPDAQALYDYDRESGMDFDADSMSLVPRNNLKYSDRDTDSVSNRSLLANALESVAKTDIEKNKLAQYKAKIALIESEQAKLTEIRAKIKELSFAKGARDTEAIKKLQFEANQAANRINTYDKQLLNLESTTALKGVLEREKSMLRKRLEQKGKESLAAYREKATKTQRELLTRYQESRKKAVESRNKTAMRHKIKNVVSDLNKLLLHPTKEQHVPIGLQKVVADALDAINMDTMNAAERVAYYNDLISKSNNPDEIASLKQKRDFFEYRDMNLKDRITALKNAYAEFKESDDPLIRNAHNDAIAELIKNTADMVGNTSLKDMSMGQLEAVYNMYKAVLATVRNSNKMFKEGRQETVTENSEAVKTEVKEVGGHKDRVLKISKFFKKFGWNMLKPVTAMKVIGSKTLAKLFDNVRSAEDTWAVDVSEAKKFYEAVSAKYGFTKWDFKKRYSFKDSAGTDFSLSLEQIMSLYAYSKREQADKHLEFGGFIFDDAIEVIEKSKLGIPMKYEVNDANPYRLRKEDLSAVVSALTQEQRGFIDEMQTYLSDVMGAKGNEVSLAMYDIKLYNETDYFPLKTSRYFREFDPEKSGTPKIKNSGFSKKTVPQAGNPIVLSNFMDVWASHVNDMSMYHAFVLPLEDFMRVYNYSSTAGGYDSVQQYIKNAYGAQANQYVEQLMDDLNGGARVDSTAGIMNKGLALFKKASVFASASVVIQQPSAIARAFAYINPKYFATSVGSALNLAKHKSVWEEMKKYAPVVIIKDMGYFDTGVGRSTVDWIKGNQTVKDKMDDVLSKAPAIADELSWAYIWEAVKRETKATTNLKVGSEEFLKKCGQRFTEVITNTQVYDSVLSRSGMMRSKDTGMKMATAFMAEPTTTANMMVDGIIQGKRGNKKFTAATVGAISSSIILNSILVALVYAARDDDEDETYLEKYLGSLTTELLDGFNPLTYVPFVKDIWSIAQGYDVERSDMSVISKLWESIEGVFNENKSGWEKVLDVTGSISSLFGIPLKNLIRDAKGMYNLAETVLSDVPTTKGGIAESIGDAFKSSIPLWDRLTESKSNSDRLYEAIISGDQNQIDRIKGRYDDDKAIESAIRKGLRDNDSRIREAAQARIDGNISEYTRIAKAIIAEGHFSQDNVVAAINAEINALKKGETSTESSASSNKVTGIYKVDDYYSALVGRDQATAYAVKEDMIRTDVANGKDRDEAEADFNSKFASYCREQYEAGKLSDYEAVNMLVNYGGKSEDAAYSKVQYWAFKEAYPDYDMSEEAVTKYYNEVESSGISVADYYTYTKLRAKCKGTDNDNDGRTDSGSVKFEVMLAIDSLPLTVAQKDALYFLNGWSRSTLWEAPWR